MIDQEVEEFLEHFGVKGMRWGVITKLRSVKQSHENRKIEGAKKYLAKADVMQTKINDLNNKLAKKGRYGYGSLRLRGKIQKLSIKKQRALKDAEAKRKGGFTFTSNQKKIAIGATAIAAIFAAQHLARTGGEDITSAVRRGQSKRKFGSIFRIDKSLASQDLTPDEVLNNVAKTVNPNYDTLGGRMNCRRATFAYELRRRGYSVDATPSAVGRGQSESGLVNALIPGDHNITRPASLSTMISGEKGIRGRPTRLDRRSYRASVGTVKDMFSAKASLYNMPVGARGEIVFDEKAFGHSMAWEKFKDGSVHIFDSQKGKRYSVGENGLEDIARSWGTPRNIAITRLDDVDLDLKFLSRWARNSS